MRHPVIEEDMERISSQPLCWEVFQGKTVLITGAAGMLPAYMVETLLRLNEEQVSQKTSVIGLVRNLDRAVARFSVYQGRDDFKLFSQDVSEPINLEQHVDFIIHGASIASPIHYGVDPVGTLAANVLGTYNLLNLAKANNVESFLFFSSGEVYGRVDSDVPTDENSYGPLDPTDVRSCYAESKRMGETMCASWFHQYDVPAKIVRPFHTYGPGMKLDDGRVFADFVADVVNGKDIVMKSDGSARRPFCYLTDATAGFFTVLLRGTHGEAYNIGNDREEVSILDLANILVGLFPEKKLNVVRQETSITPGYLKSKISRNCPDISKVRTLGWEPSTTIEEGFKRTIRSFQ